MKFDQEEFDTAHEILKVLSSETRLQILLLLERTPMTVNELVQALNMSQPGVSKQLRILRDYRLVSFNKDGQHSVYSLDDTHVLTVVDATMGHARHILGRSS